MVGQLKFEHAQAKGCSRGVHPIFDGQPGDGERHGSRPRLPSGEPQLSEAERAPLAALSWGIEQYHRGLKQCCGVEKAQVRAARAQRNRIGCAMRALSAPRSPAPAHRPQLVRSQKTIAARRYPNLFDKPNLIFCIAQLRNF